MQKITVLYGHPTDAQTFDTYYREKHIPLVNHLELLSKIEYTRIHGGPGGSKSDFFLMAELYFQDESQMQETMGSPEGQALVDDLGNFATGGVTIMMGNTISNW